MRAQIEKYLSILKIELEDLEEDIVSLIELTRQRTQNREITEYVGLGNESLLRAEFSGIKSVAESVDAFDTGRYSNLDEFVSDLLEQLKDKITASGFPDSVYLFVERKAIKVAKYVSEQI